MVEDIKYLLFPAIWVRWAYLRLGTMQPTIPHIIRCKFGRVTSRVRPGHADRDRNFAYDLHVDQDSANAEPSAKLSPVFVAGHDKREPDVALANPHVWPMVSHLILRLVASREKRSDRTV